MNRNSTIYFMNLFIFSETVKVIQHSNKIISEFFQNIRLNTKHRKSGFSNI